MAKKIRKRRANYFDNGGFSWQKGAGFGKNIGNAFNSGALNSAIGAASSIAGQGISGGLSSGAGNAMQGLGSIANAIPGPWGAIAGAGLNVIGGLVNKAFGSQINEQAVQEAKSANTQQSNMQFAASNTTDLLNQSNFGLLGNIKKSDIGKDGWFSNKAKNLTAELNRQREAANLQAIANFEAAAENVDTQNDLNALANYAAYGGPLTMRYTGTMSPFGNTFADGGKIYIKPENRGKFTALKERTGKSATWFKEHGTPAQKKMATFALNSRKWEHAFGGNLITNGAEWDNGLTIIGNGGTHEENPMEGVQMGMDAQGIPNLVEEGEVIFNDYVFSNRMKVPKAIRSKYKLRENKDITFADAAKKIAKESEERPNDPISRRGLISSMTRLQQAQETVRQQNQVDQEGIQYAHGGRMGNLFDGTGPEDNYLEARNFYENYSNNIYGKNPYMGYSNPAPVPDDNELLDIARVRLGEEPKGSVTPVLEPLINNNSNSNNTSNNSNSTWMRYAPVAAAGAGTLTDALGWTNKPDYSNADTIFDTINSGNYTPVSAALIGNYLTYKPFDRNNYINKFNAQSSATRRAIINQSAGNRATALAGLLAADRNALDSQGDLAIKAEEFNLGQEERRATFNRGTKQFNSEMGLRAAMSNQNALASLRDYRLKGALAAAQMRENTKRLADTNRSANLTNFTQGLGDIGSENVGWNQLQWAIEHGVFGPMQDEISKGYRRKNGSKLLTKGG